MTEPTPTPTPTPSPTPTPAPAWHDGIDPAVKGFWETKGLPINDPKEFGVKLTEIYRNAEKLIGVPPDQVVKIPKSDAPPADLRAYYERLGAPKEAKDYDLAAVTDNGVAEALRASMYERGVSKDAAASIATSVSKALAAKTEADNAVTTAKLADDKASLTKNWGDKFAYNHLQAIEGARRLGISAEGVKALEGQIGYAAVMEAMRKIGANTREGDFVERGAGGPAGDVTTLEGAKARKTELMGDKAWVEKYNSGDPAAKREMTRLNSMITGTSA